MDIEGYDKLHTLENWKPTTYLKSDINPFNNPNFQQWFWTRKWWIFSIDFYEVFEKEKTKKYCWVHITLPRITLKGGD